MMKTFVLVFALITFVSSEPVRIVSPTKTPKVYVSPESAPNQFIMEDSSQVEGLAQVNNEPTTPYYTGPAQHEKKGTPGAAFLSEKDSIVPAQMVPTDVLNDPQALWDLKGAEKKHNEEDVNGMMPADPIPGFDSANPVMVQGSLSSPATSVQTPAATSNSESTEGVVEADVVALEKEANVEEEKLREIKAQIVQKKQAHVVEKEMKFKEKLVEVEKQKDVAIEKIKQQAAEQERLVLEQEAEEASKLAQEQTLSPAEKNEKQREATPLPIVSQAKNTYFMEESSHINKIEQTAGAKIVRMREVIQSKKKEKKDKKDKKDEVVKTDAEEEIREAQASKRLRDSVVSNLAEEANKAENLAHHEANIAQVELNRAKSDQNGWSFLRTATHHIQDAAAYLKQKEQNIALQDFVNHQDDTKNTENVETTVTLVDPATVIDDSSFIQVNRNVMKAIGVRPARALMNTIKQMKASM